MSEVILSIKELSMDFPGVKALDNISLDVYKGDVMGLCGENGAGKSTLIKILTGVYKQSHGTFFFKGHEAKISTPLDAQKLGLSVVHQEIKLVDELSIKENIFLGRPLLNKRKFVDWKKMRQEAKCFIDKLGVQLNVDQKVENLSVAQKQIVEICKALVFNAELIIMDEPSATLTEKEMDLLYKIIDNLKAAGVTIIYISHRLEEVFRIANRVCVLRDGKLIGVEPIKKMTRNSLIKMMVGREIGQEFPEPIQNVGKEVLRVEKLKRNGVLKDISFSLYKGEILGLGGLVGAGRTEVVRAIIGLDRVGVSGNIYLNGKKVLIKNPCSAIRNRIGTITEDRKIEGLILEMELQKNISIANIRSIMNKGLLNKKREQKLALEMIRKLDIATPSERQKATFLSGGNQQKVVIAKWLNTDSDIFIFDEPTRGIDVGAKEEIYHIMAELVRAGKSIIMISSEMPELIGMCNRILVMHNGRVSGELKRSEVTQEKILALAID